MSRGFADIHGDTAVTAAPTNTEIAMSTGLHIDRWLAKAETVLAVGSGSWSRRTYLANARAAFSYAVCQGGTSHPISEAQ